MKHKRILLAVDLDYTHFDTNNGKWIAGEGFWQGLYDRFSTLLSNHGIELVFAVVTQKEEFDDLCEMAMIAFEHFLAKQNPHMFKRICGVTHSLVEHKGVLHYFKLDGIGRGERCQFTDPTASHFHVVGNGQSKAAAIRKIAAHYGIELYHSIMLDDNPDVLREVSRHRIKTVSVEPFRDAGFLLRDRDFVLSTLNNMAYDLLAVITDMIDSINPPEHMLAAEPKNASSCNLTRALRQGITFFARILPTFSYTPDHSSMDNSMDPAIY